MRKRSLFSLLMLSMISCTALAQPLADLVPADALLYVGWSGSEAQGAAYEQSNLHRLVEDGDLRAAMAQSLAAIKAIAEQGNPADADATPEFAFLGPICEVVWRRPTAFWLSPIRGEHDPDTPFGFTLVCDAGDAGPELLANLRQLVADGDEEANIQTSLQGSLVRLSVQHPSLADGLAAGKSIKQNTRFTQALGHIQPDAALIAYVDGDGWVAVGNAASEAQDDETWPKVRDGLGLNGMRAAVLSAGFEGKDWRTRAYIDAPAPRRGLAKLLDGSAGAPEALKLVPRDAVMAWLLSLDLGAVLDETRAAIQAIDPEAQASFDGAIGMASMMTGADIENALLRGLGSQWVLFIDPAVAGPGPLGMCLANRLSDPAAVEQSLTAIENVIQAIAEQRMQEQDMHLRFHVEQRDGLTLHRLGVPAVSPTWAIQDGVLFVGLYPQTVSMAAAHAREQGPSILERPELAGARQQLAGDRVAAFSFVDLPKTAPTAYQVNLLMTQLFLGMAEMSSGQPIPPALPPLAKVQACLAPSTLIALADDNGLSLDSHSPFPGSSMFGPQGGADTQMTAMMVGVMLPALGAARRTARQVQDSTQARGIHQAMVIQCQTVKANKSGNKPLTDDIATLIEGNYVTVEYVISPAVGITIPPDIMQWPAQQRADWVRKNASYIILPNLEETLNPDEIALFLRPEIYDDRGTVVRNDNSTAFESDYAAIEKQLLKQTGMTMQQLIERQESLVGRPIQ